MLPLETQNTLHTENGSLGFIEISNEVCSISIRGQNSIFQVTKIGPVKENENRVYTIMTPYQILSQLAFRFKRISSK